MTNEEIIDHLYVNNGRRYNLHKASEECQELGLILNQHLLRDGGMPEQAIIDEIGDVIIRVEILKKMFPMDKIQARVDSKLAAFEGYIDHKLYNEI